MALTVDRIDSGPPFHSNCYLVRERADAAEAVAIDPGGRPADVVDALRRHGAKLAGILVTHTDIDHIAAVAELHQQTAAAVWAPKREADALAGGLTRTGTPISPHSAEHLVVAGDRIALAGIEFEAFGVPGHSAGHVAFAAAGALFAGDLLFAGSVGRTDLPGGDAQALMRSIAMLLERLGPDTVVYPGHGEATSLGIELATNPYLGPLRGR